MSASSNTEIPGASTPDSGSRYSLRPRAEASFRSASPPSSVSSSRRSKAWVPAGSPRTPARTQMRLENNESEDPFAEDVRVQSSAPLAEDEKEDDDDDEARPQIRRVRGRLGSGDDDSDFNPETSSKERLGYDVSHTLNRRVQMRIGGSFDETGGGEFTPICLRCLRSLLLGHSGGQCYILDDEPDKCERCVAANKACYPIPYDELREHAVTARLMIHGRQRNSPECVALLEQLKERLPSVAICERDARRLRDQALRRATTLLSSGPVSPRPSLPAPVASPSRTYRRSRAPAPASPSVAAADSRSFGFFSRIYFGVWSFIYWVIWQLFWLLVFVVSIVVFFCLYELDIAHMDPNNPMSVFKRRSWEVKVASGRDRRRFWF
ncbi:hypothetical protein NHQ30_011376 [Ciborinia camelliae]|nr:hypothetical protein NHQ30_011376 [Ciborinia camelliae]